MGRSWSKSGGSRDLWSDLNDLCLTGGRFAGSESERRARDFLRDRLAAATGTPVLPHEVDHDGWVRESCTLSRVSPTRSPLQAHSLVRSPATPPGGIEGEMVDLGRGTLEDFAAHEREIPGRLVLVRHEYMFATGHVHRRKKYLWAKERGAIGFLIASHLPGQVLVTGSSGIGAPDDIPAVGITQESAHALARVRDQYARVVLDLRAQCGVATAQNLIAEIPGLTPDWVVLCAHYDGHDLAQSAMDNGTGVAVALTVARNLAPLVPSLRRGLRVAFFTIEEWGLMGSRHYVDQLSEDECERIALVVNLDSVAGSSRLTALTSRFEELDRFLLGVADEVGIRLGTFRPIMANSDHYNFVRRGIPAFRLVAGFDEPDSRLRYLLTPGDTIDKVSPTELKTAALLTAEIVLSACMADGPIARRRNSEEVRSMLATHPLL
ncbi:MAG: M28 family peptidase [Nitrospiraceae bacterium]